MIDTSTREGAQIVIARVVAVGAFRTLKRIARDHGVSAVAVVGRKRDARTSMARHRLWAVMRWTLGLSYQDLGAMFDRDHTSVLHGVRKYEKAIAEQEAA